MPNLTYLYGEESAIQLVPLAHGVLAFPIVLGAVALGKQGEHSRLVPVEIHSVSDLFERYRDLVAFFKDTEVAGVTVLTVQEEKITSDYDPRLDRR